VFYIHPWEVDPDQPRLESRWKSRLRHYRNLAYHASQARSTLAVVNEECVIASKIRNTLELDYPKSLLKILVVSDGSDDRTVEIAQEYHDQNVTVLDLKSNRGKATALNEAGKDTETDLLCLCDANVMFCSDSLARMIRHFADSAVGAVSGSVIITSQESDFGAGESVYCRLERAVHMGETRLGSSVTVDGGMYVIRRELFRKIPANTILDDFVIAMHVIRAGFRVVFEPSAVAFENGTPTGNQEYWRRVRVTEGAVQTLKTGIWPPVSRPFVFWNYVSHKLLRWLGPFLLIAFISSNALLFKEGEFYQLIFAGQFVFYVLALTATLIISFRKTAIGGITYFFVMSHVAMIHGWWRGIFRRQTGRWRRTERKLGTSHAISSK
jgi:poly-beta-1,6-N-acetyl-D-glucosamine synthase